MEVEKSYDIQNAGEVTQQNIGKIDWHQTIT